MQSFEIIKNLLILIIIGCSIIQGHYISYDNARRNVLRAEDLLLTGGRINLNRKESKVDDHFMQYKLEELSEGYHNSELNAPALHFFKAKKLIESSKIFRFLQRMPKGALLHVHSTASVSSEWVVQNISYMTGLLRCTNKYGISILSFRQQPQEQGCYTQYVSVAAERYYSANPEEYDRAFEKLINLYTPQPELVYDSADAVWTKFQNMFSTTYDMLLYLPAYRAYHWRMLEEMYEDNVMYAEVRMDFKELYDSSGRTFPPERTVMELLNIIEEFRRQHSDFHGIKVIFSTQRKVEPNRVREKFERFKKLHYAYPDFIIGFDLVGQEDKGKSLHNFLNQILDLPPTAHYFFHAGETNWYGASIDNNLLDAILLNTSRIGHGYALLKHPVLWNAVKTSDIAVEVSPISNQVLHLVSDLRNHPASFFMSENIPLVISNDDPGYWNAKGLSYDFYYAIMSLAPSYAGIKMLKGLVWNSINYSVLNQTEREIILSRLEYDWERFMDEVLAKEVAGI